MLQKAWASWVTTAALAVAIVALAANAGVWYRNGRQLQAAESIVQHTLEVLGQTYGLVASATDAATSQRGFLLSGDESFLPLSRSGRDDAAGRLAALRTLTSDNAEQSPRMTALAGALNDLDVAIDAGIVRRRAQDQAGSHTPADRAGLYQSLYDTRTALDRLRDVTRQTRDTENALLVSRSDKVRVARLQTIWTIVIATVAAMATVVGAYGLIVRDQRRQSRFVREQAKLAEYNRLLIESTGEGIYGIDTDGNCTFLNAAGERILGYKSADVLGKNVHELVHHHRPDGTPYPVADCPIYKAFRSGESCRVTDEVFFRADGTAFPVEYAANPIKTGRRKIEGAVVTFADVTDARKQQAIARESSERFRTMADNIPQLAWMAEADGSIYWYNQRWFDYTGTEHGQTNGRNWQTVHHPDHVDAATHKYLASVAAGTEWEDTFPLKGADGEYRWFLSRAVPIRDDDGRVVRWFGTNTDVTEARENEEALRRSRERIQSALHEVEAAKDEAEAARQAAVDANIAKSQFLANMSHELRTPLNAVIMYSELLQEEAEDAKVPQFIPDLDKIRGAGKHLLSLVNGVLDLSKIEAGKMDLYLETFDVAAMAKEVGATVMPLVQKNGNTLDERLPEGGLSMHSDLTKVRQVLFNLLSNASKFTEKGTIGLRIESEPAEDGGWIDFVVTDTGLGMTPEQLGKLFLPFTQADASTTRKFGGTGLGLAISKRFCEMLGGTVTATSETGKGSTFTVRLPTRLSKPAPAKPVPVGAAAAATTALIIDDDAGVREMVIRTLAADDVQAVSAGDGETGLTMARDLRPDMIFLDVMMPKMDGWAVLTALKADPATASIPVVMLTLMNETEMGYLLGASEYLHKPIDRDRLASVIGKYKAAAGANEVLIVEDDDTTREVLRRSLVKEGWTVLEAINGKNGIEQMRRHVPALILSDLMMPEMDGFEFIDAVRGKPEWAAVPIVVLTSKDLSHEDRARLTGNVERIVQKGTYSRDALLGEVRRIAAEHVKRAAADTDVANAAATAAE